MDGTVLCVKFPAPMFRQIIAPEQKRIRQVCINCWNMVPLDMDPDLFGMIQAGVTTESTEARRRLDGDGITNYDLKHRNRHTALEQIEEKFGKRRVITGTRALLAASRRSFSEGGSGDLDKPKCPFIPSRGAESDESGRTRIAHLLAES